MSRLDETRCDERQTAAREGGYSLISILVAMAIIGLTLMILLTGLSTAALGTAIVTQRTAAENYGRTQMEMIKAAPYSPDPTAEPYPLIGSLGVYTAEVSVRYWISPTFTSTPPEEDEGLQEITISIFSSRMDGGPVFRLQGYKGER
jgi:type II secretory pathway pseudopilin PulG